MCKRMNLPLVCQCKCAAHKNNFVIEVAQVTETFYYDSKEPDSIFEGQSSYNEAPTDEHFISPSVHNTGISSTIKN